MEAAKTDILSRLRMDILARQGLQKTHGAIAMDMGLGAMTASFPNRVFPLAAVHEFVCTDQEGKAATTGFISGLLATLMKAGGSALWVTAAPLLFPSALAGFGIHPDRIIMVNLSREKDLLWMMEEGLRCDGLSAVVGEFRNLDFTASRRLQLAVEQSKVTGFVIRQTEHQLSTTACVSRWKITSTHSDPGLGLPGISFPRWNVELQKIRNGRPGHWLVEWSEDGFKEIIHQQVREQIPVAKTA